MVQYDITMITVQYSYISHVDIKVCCKRTINEMFTLINHMKNHFCVSLVSKNSLTSNGVKILVQ